MPCHQRSEVDVIADQIEKADRAQLIHELSNGLDRIHDSYFVVGCCSSAYFSENPIATIAETLIKNRKTLIAEQGVLGQVVATTIPSTPECPPVSAVVVRHQPYKALVTASSQFGDYLYTLVAEVDSRDD